MESLVKPFGYEAVLRNPPIQTIRRGGGSGERFKRRYIGMTEKEWQEFR